MRPLSKIRELTPEEDSRCREALVRVFGSLVPDIPLCMVFVDGRWEGPVVHRGKLFGTWDGVPLPPTKWKAVE